MCLYESRPLHPLRQNLGWLDPGLRRPILSQNQKKRTDRTLGRLMLTLAIGFIVLTTANKVCCQEKVSRELVKYRGRPLAFVNASISGAGVGPKFQQFVFSISRLGKKPDSPNLVRIVYEYFEPSERLQTDFLTSSKEFQLELFRKPSCDDAVGNFAYELFGDERVSILRPLPGAKDEMIPNAQVLSCFVLRPGKIRGLK